MLTATQYIARKAKLIEAALALTAGLENIEHYYPINILSDADREYRGLTLHGAMKIAAREHGANVKGLTADQLFVEAFTVPTYLRASNFSTISLPGVLGNLAGKYLTAGFQGIESAWRSVAAIRTAKDFKVLSSFAMADNVEYEGLGNAGEIKHGALGQVSYNNQLVTYAKMFVIPRRDWTNDDLGAFVKVPKELGRGAALALNRTVWTLFLGSLGTLFTVGNINYLSGAGSALSATSLGTALATFRKQTDPTNEPIGIVPKFLLVPPELEGTAYSLLHNTTIAGNTAGDTQAKPWQSLLIPATSSYLSNTNYSGSSATAWYLLADPADLATLEVAFLEGHETPTIESAQPDINTLGFKIRGVFDFGVAVQEYRAGVMSAGQ